MSPTGAGPSRLNERADSLRGRLRLRLLRPGKVRRAAGPMGMGEMTSAEIGSTRARVVPVVEFPRVVIISIRMFLATGAVLMIGGETRGIIIRRRIKTGAVEIDGISVVNRRGGGAGVLVTEILLVGEDRIAVFGFFTTSPSFLTPLHPYLPTPRCLPPSFSPSTPPVRLT